ncbi:FAD binding domain-containing protein [Ochrobactrum teleogrylli]|uniref:FAD binding domain-containing protein n=1 Tax=Ochrobactrum teleogrylli TaxID=2479765 RepID=UPI00384FE190
MKPRPFDYVRAESVADALDQLAQHGDNSRILAGGQSLMAMLNLRLVDPGTLIDIGRIDELKRIERKSGWVEIGAAVTQNELLSWPHLQACLPLLARALPFVGHFQTRNRGTICGSIAHADPSSEIPLVLAALSGEVVLRSRRKTRTLAASDFQTGMLTTARNPDELIVAVRLPEHGGTESAFREVARRHGDFAIVALAAIVEPDKSARLAIGGVADRPLVHRFTASESASADSLAATIDSIAWRAGGYDDVHATARYRRDLVRRLAPLVIEEALSCAA